MIDGYEMQSDFEGIYRPALTIKAGDIVIADNKLGLVILAEWMTQWADDQRIVIDWFSWEDVGFTRMPRSIQPRVRLYCRDF